MYTCIFVCWCTYVYMPIYIYICMYVYMYMCVHMCVCAYTNIHAYRYISTCMYIYIYMYLQMYTYTHNKAHTKHSNSAPTAALPAEMCPALSSLALLPKLKDLRFFGQCVVLSLRLVGSWRLYVSFAECSLFYRALLQKRLIILLSVFSSCEWGFEGMNSFFFSWWELKDTFWLCVLGGMSRSTLKMKMLRILWCFGKRYKVFAGCSC